MGPILFGVLGAIGAIVIGILIFAASAVSIYNRLVALQNEFKNQFAQMDVQLKRRHGLIPSLIETAKGYMAHERGTLDQVAAARNGAVDARRRTATDPAEAGAVPRIAAAEGALTQSLGRFLAVAEAYPDLKADQSMLQLQNELANTENRVAASRQSYNDAVRNYNTQRQIFPNSLLADMFNFPTASLYEIIESSEREIPKVAFT